jgi:UPF0755 protein
MTRRILIAGVIVFGIMLAGLGLARQALHEPLSLPRSGVFLLDVPAGTSLGGVTRMLGDEGILRNSWVLAAYGRLSGDAAKIKAGEYEIAAGTTPLELLRQLVEGRVKLYSLTLIEGWTIRDVMRAIKKNAAIRHTLPADDEKSLARALDLPMDQPEGWLFPDTYRFARHTTDRELLSMAHTRMKVVLERAWAGRKKGVPLQTPYEALILASIVEKETSLDRERPRIAGVFTRRLVSGMKLQTDPTVIYGLGEDYDGDLTRRHLTRDTPYNTYTRTGLPPTPIAMPGESSLLAAVHPDDSDDLYFVATGDEDGSHSFSATLREHNAAVKQYLVATRERAKE